MKKESNKNDKNETAINKKQIERREFLKLGATGVAAGLAGCAAPGVLGPAVVVENSANAPIPSAVNAGPGSIPDVGDMIDPELFQAGNWQEPWSDYSRKTGRNAQTACT